MKKSIYSVQKGLRLPAFGLALAALLTLIPGWANAPYCWKNGAASATSVSAKQAKGVHSASTQSYTASKKKAYEQKISNSLDQMQQNIGDLRVKIQTIVPQKKRMMLKAMIELQNMENVARGKLKTLKTAPESDWGRCKKDMDKAMADLDRGYAIVESHLS